MNLLRQPLVSLTLCVLLFLPTVPAVGADAPSVEEIVKRTEHTSYYLGKDGRARVSMVITDAQGRKRKRRLTILRWDQRADAEELEKGVGIQKYYVHIGYPSDLRNTILMVWKPPTGDDDRWIYLPSLDLNKRIAASDKRTSFLGSDFFYEDISGRSTNLDHHQLQEVTDDYYVIRNTPRQPESVEFSHYVMWVHRHTYLAVKAEFFDRQGSKYRTYEALAVETIQGRPTVIRSRMQDHAKGQETRLEFSRVKYNTGIDEEIFTERYLRNPPRDALR